MNFRRRPNQEFSPVRSLWLLPNLLAQSQVVFDGLFHFPPDLINRPTLERHNVLKPKHSPVKRVD